VTALLERTAHTPEAWRDGMTAIYRAGEAMLKDGKLPHVELSEEGDTLTLRQLRFIHGPILQQISEQVVVEGVRYTRDVWKEHLKDLFIPDQFVMVRLPFVRDKAGNWKPSRRKVPRKVEKSLTKLTGRARSDFIDQVLAHAATEWGVEFVFTFDEREAVRYRPPKRKPVTQPQERGEAVPA
jgi:hypothetical protein